MRISLRAGSSIATSPALPLCIAMAVRAVAVACTRCGCERLSTFGGTSWPQPARLVCFVGEQRALYQREREMTRGCTSSGRCSGQPYVIMIPRAARARAGHSPSKKNTCRQKIFLGAQTHNKRYLMHAVGVLKVKFYLKHGVLKVKFNN